MLSSNHIVGIVIGAIPIYPPNHSMWNELFVLPHFTGKQTDPESLVKILA